MKNRILLAAGRLAVSRRAPSSASGGELVERIVARVNDRLITQTEFDKRMDGRAARAPTRPRTSPSSRRTRWTT